MDWQSWRNWFKKQPKSEESTELKRIGSDSLQQLQQENERLRRTVDSLISKFGSNEQVDKSSLDLSEEDKETLKRLLVTRKDTSPVMGGEPEGDTVKLIDSGELTRRTGKMQVQPDKTQSADEEASGTVTVDTYKNAVFVKSSQKDEVAVLDMKAEEWWTIVNPSTLEDDNKDITFEASELGDSFAVVQHDDVNEAIANYLAISVERNPDAKQLSPSELKRVLESTLSQAKRQGTFTQAYGWGMFLYSSYSWGSYVVRIYKEPTLVKLVLSAARVLYNQPVLIPVMARGLWSAASWAVIAVFL